MGILQRYINDRIKVAQDNFQDVVDAAMSGYWQEIIHFIGADAPSILSQRMEMRRAWARQRVFKDDIPYPNLPKIEPGSLKTNQ